MAVMTVDLQLIFPQSDRRRFAGKDEDKPARYHAAYQLCSTNRVGFPHSIVSITRSYLDQIWRRLRQIVWKQAQSIGLQIHVPASDSPELFPI